MGSTARTALGWLATAACLGLIAGLHTAADSSSANLVATEKKMALSLSEPLIPSASVLKAISLGDTQVVADALWMETIQYFGGGNPYGNYPSLGPIVQTVTTLDPKFEEPYEFGLVVLPFMGQTDSAIALGEKVQTAQPGNGLLDYYYASDLLLYKKDYAQAAKYYQKASTEKGAPSSAITLAGVAFEQTKQSINDKLIAIAYWQTVEDNAKSDDQRQEAENRKENVQIAYDLENAAKQYKATYGKVPATLQDLVSSHIISAIPVSPIGRSYSIDPATGVVSFETVGN